MGNVDTIRKRVLGIGATDEYVAGVLMREFHCVDAIVGADYEVRDSKGNLIASIRRKPLCPEQIIELQKILVEVSKQENRRMKKRG